MILKHLWIAQKMVRNELCVSQCIYIYCIHYITTHCSMYIRAIIIAHKQILHRYIYIYVHLNVHTMLNVHIIYIQNIIIKCMYMYCIYNIHWTTYIPCLFQTLQVLGCIMDTVSRTYTSHHVITCNNNLSYVNNHVLQQVLYIIDFIQ